MWKLERKKGTKEWIGERQRDEREVETWGTKPLFRGNGMNGNELKK